MPLFILIRLARAFITIAVVITFVFVVLRASGDPALALLSPETPVEAVEAFRKAWGLDAPLWVQYVRYLFAVGHGDLGQSMRDGRAAITVVAERIPVTLMLTAPALMLNLMIGIPAGIYAALKRDSLADRLVMMVAVVGFTVPSFVLGLLFILAFAVELPLVSLWRRRHLASRGAARHHPRSERRGRFGPLQPQRHARGAGTALYSCSQRQGGALDQGCDRPRAAQCCYSGADHRRFHVRQSHCGNGAR